jgi:uncharacterized membrane protein YeaQ/YmgE (transglycosylase-associated protein family)
VIMVHGPIDLRVFPACCRPGIYAGRGGKGVTAMQVTGYLGAVLIGAVVGLLGRLILPGRQRIGVFATFVIGVAAALLGTFVARRFHIDHDAPVKVGSLRWDWIVLALQVGFAVIGVAFANMLTFTRLAGGDETPRRRSGRSRARR